MSRQETDAARGLSYRPDIDGLRAVAVLGVMLFHAGLPGVSGGFVGVDVFFVISGYLITGLLAVEYERSGRIDFRAFFVRRIRRLLPALALVVVVTLAIALITMFPLDARRLGKSAQAVGLLIANIHFKNFSGGYFDPSMDIMPLLHTWSLAVEEQYYLAWPLLFWLAHRLWKRDRSGADTALALHRTTIVLLFVIALTSFIACVWMSGQERGAAFYLTPYRAWEFALGALLAHVAHHLRSLPGWLGNLLGLGGLAMIVATMALLDDRFAFPGAIALVPVLGSVAVIAGGSVTAARWSKVVLGNRLMVAIGLMSYSLYLWHWPLLALGRDYALGARDLPRDLGLLALAVVLAWLSYRFIEQPIRQKKPGLFATARGTFWMAALLSLCVIVTANAVMYWSKIRNQQIDAQTQVATDIKQLGARYCQHEGKVFALPLPPGCGLGATQTPVRLVAWGDSHAYQLIPMLKDFAENNRLHAQVLSSGACPPLADAIPFKRGEGDTACGRFNEAAIADLRTRATRGLRGIVLGARWNSYLDLPTTEPGGTQPSALANHWRELDRHGTEMESGHPPLDSAGSARTLQVSLHATLTALTAQGLRVLIVAPTPELYFNGPLCLYRRSAEQCTVSRARVEARRELAMNAISLAVRGLPNVRVIDPINEFCDDLLCHTFRNGKLLYSDDNHISPAMATMLAQRYASDLQWAADSSR